MKVNCKALEPWQGSHGETHHARAEPWGRCGARPGWSVWVRGGTGSSRGHFSPDASDIAPGGAALSPPTEMLPPIPLICPRWLRRHLSVITAVFGKGGPAVLESNRIWRCLRAELVPQGSSQHCSFPSASPCHSQGASCAKSWCPGASTATFLEF